MKYLFELLGDLPSKFTLTEKQFKLTVEKFWDVLVKDGHRSLFEIQREKSGFHLFLKNSDSEMFEKFAEGKIEFLKNHLRAQEAKLNLSGTCYVYWSIAGTCASYISIISSILIQAIDGNLRNSFDQTILLCVEMMKFASKVGNFDLITRFCIFGLRQLDQNLSTNYIWS